MSEALSSTLAAAALTVGYHQAAAAAAAPVTAQPQAIQPPAQAPGNVNAPFFISPKVSFDPITSIVFVTFRNFETGKIREQIPPVEVLSRYREATRTGHPDPLLPPLPGDKPKSEAAPTPATPDKAAQPAAATLAAAPAPAPKPAPTATPTTTDTIA